MEGHTGAVRSVVALRNNRVASCALDRTVRVWRCGLRRGACLFKLNGHKDWCMQLIVVENGLLATASEDGSVRIWEAWGGRPKCVKTLGTGQSKDGHRGGVTCLTRTPHGRVMSGGRDKQLYLWSSLHWCSAKLPPPPPPPALALKRGGSKKGAKRTNLPGSPKLKKKKAGGAASPKKKAVPQS